MSIERYPVGTNAHVEMKWAWWIPIYEAGIIAMGRLGLLADEAKVRYWANRGLLLRYSVDGKPICAFHTKAWWDRARKLADEHTIA